ncbi:conserved hypothetical protein [Vibrio jasicida]|uniref:hypothetical protein n=1 Tax=Vibrio jasicida TaxID=766224 RepID=UPI002895E913|nr:conserved hypothetical protein [Vibrio jasicida]
MQLLYSEQRENTFLLLLMACFSIGLMLFGSRLADFVMPEPLVKEEEKEVVSLMLAPISPDNSTLEAEDSSNRPLSESASLSEAEKLSDEEVDTKDGAIFMLAKEPEPEPEKPVATQANSDAQALSAMFGASLGAKSEVIVAKTSTVSQKEAGKKATSSSQKSTNNSAAFDINDNDGVNKALVNARDSLREETTSQGNGSTNKSELLSREKSNQSGKVEQHIATLFADVNQELRRLMMVYGLRKQSVRVTLYFTQGVVDNVSLNEGSADFKREVQSLLIGRRIEMAHTGTKSHVLVVN